MNDASQQSPYDIPPPFTWNGSDELKLREILDWIYDAPAYKRHALVEHAYTCVDYELYHLLHEPKLQDGDRRHTMNPPMATRSREAAKRLVEVVYPSFWQTSGQRAGRANACIGPDFNGPNRDLLLKTWNPDIHHAGFSAVLEPADGPWRECLALLACLIRAVLIEREIAPPQGASQ